MGLEAEPGGLGSAASRQGAGPARASQHLQLHPPAHPCAQQMETGNFPTLKTPAVTHLGDALGSTRAPWGWQHHELQIAATQRHVPNLPVLGAAAQHQQGHPCSPHGAGEYNEPEPQQGKGCFLSLLQELQLWFNSFGFLSLSHPTSSCLIHTRQQTEGKRSTQVQMRMRAQDCCIPTLCS